MGFSALDKLYLAAYEQRDAIGGFRERFVLPK